MNCLSNITCRTCPVREKTVENALSPSELEKVEHFRVFDTWKRGDTIFHQGEPVDNHYSIFEGVVRLVRTLADGRRTVIGFLFPGDLFGLSNSDIYTYSAEAVTGGRICRFPKAKMQPMYDSHPKLKATLIDFMTSKLERAEKRIAELARKNSEERLASFLLAVDFQGSLTDDDQVITLPMNREDIADYLGLSLETTSRNFTILTKKGLIEFRGKNKIVITNRNKLIQISGGS